LDFGLIIPNGWRGELGSMPPDERWPAVVDAVGQAEAFGFDSVWAYDHALLEPGRDAAEPRADLVFEPFTLLAALAPLTTRVRLGQLVTNAALRPAGYLAHVMRSLAAITGGRLILGIGAGWNEAEHQHLDVSFPSPGARIAALQYSIERVLERVPAADRPTILVGGGGERGTLRVAARLADWADFGGTPSLADFEHKSSVLADHCAAVGRDFDEIVRVAHFDCLIAPTRDEAEQRLQAAERAGYRRDDATAALIGTPDEIVGELRRWQAAGCRYVILYFADTLTGRSARLFAGEVAPRLADS
jgi:alkanesulfonate monooxygenase SsuD/methylene tetrahydromethanopterin reductase-like flavin-dependent oxidoreductase (luciferase family)